MGGGGYFEVCLDDIFPNSERQRNFFQVWPNTLNYIDTTPGGNNFAGESIVMLWNANKERSSRLDDKICHEIGSPEGEKALTIAPSFEIPIFSPDVMRCDTYIAAQDHEFWKYSKL